MGHISNLLGHDESPMAQSTQAPTLAVAARRGTDLSGSAGLIEESRASALETVCQRPRLVVERGAQVGPARAGAFDLLLDLLPRAGLAVPGAADRVGGQPLPQGERHLLERGLAGDLGRGAEQRLEAGAEPFPALAPGPRLWPP